MLRAFKNLVPTWLSRPAPAGRPPSAGAAARTPQGGSRPASRATGRTAASAGDGPAGPRPASRASAGSTSVPPSLAGTYVRPDAQRLREDMEALTQIYAGQLGHQDLYFHGLVSDYNARFPGMNVRYAPSFQGMVDRVAAYRRELADGPLHFIACNGAGHRSAWRIQEVEGALVAIGIDSSTLEGPAAFARSDERELRDAAAQRPGVLRGGLALATGVQKDQVSCPAFCVQFLNTFRLHPEHFDELAGHVHALAHGASPTGGREAFQAMGPDAAQALLPAHAMKNAQSRAYLTGYLERNPEVAQGPVSRSGESVVERLQRLTGHENPLAAADREEMSVGIRKKSVALAYRTLEQLEGELAERRGAGPAE